MCRGRWAVAVGVVALTALAVVVYDRAPRHPRERQSLEGTWSGADGTTVSVHDDLLVFTQPGPNGTPRVMRMFFRLEPRYSPKRIVTFDADDPSNHGRSGPEPGRPGNECPGIYEIRGDRLRLCIGVPGGSFPADFDPASGLLLDLEFTP
jgi:uncharacterized protein (TIGR03067 family)